MSTYKELLDKYEKEIEEFQSQLVDNWENVDPTQNLHWYELTIGFFLGKNIPIEEATRLAEVLEY